MPQRITVRQLLEDDGAALQLRILAGAEGLDRGLDVAEINRPSLALAGFTDKFSWDRAQVLGVTEAEYLQRVGRSLRARRIDRMFEFDMPCVILTTDIQPIPELLAASRRRGIPLLGTPLNTSDFCKTLGPRLEMIFAPRLQVHAGLVEIFGMGTLLIGRSGVGKSECALELIERGHRLVADDIVVLRRLPLNRVVGASNAMLRHHLELRGIGVVDVESLFGAGSVREFADIDLVVRLEKWDDRKQYERIGLDTPTTSFLDVAIPEYTIPVEPGRNTSILVEVAALQQRLKNRGRNPAALFEQAVLERMRAASTKSWSSPLGDAGRPRVEPTLFDWSIPAKSSMPSASPDLEPGRGEGR
jgi:HPr kinase/phosphorylase